MNEIGITRRQVRSLINSQRGRRKRPHPGFG
jgi:hypothetical protein